MLFVLMPMQGAFPQPATPATPATPAVPADQSTPGATAAQDQAVPALADAPAPGKKNKKIVGAPDAESAVAPGVD